LSTATIVRAARCSCSRTLRKSRWKISTSVPPGGGRVHYGETAQDGLAREMREELLVDIEIGGLLWVVENFFHLLERDFHELSFYFRMDVPETLRWPRVEHFQRKDGERDITLHWHPLKELDSLALRPSFLKQRLGEPLSVAPEHLIQRG
jgi:ADP-ribose pyrophosphatase YjhB (NUDIX family)